MNTKRRKTDSDIQVDFQVASNYVRGAGCLVIFRQTKDST